MTKVVEFKNFSFKYLGSRNYAVKDINLEIEEGSIVGVIGPTGSGKSTLLMSLMGIVPHYYPGISEGEVRVCGINVREHEITELAKYVGIVLQDPRVQVFQPRVWDDVAFGPINLCLPKREVINRVNYAINAVRLKGFEDRNPSTLSGGEQQSLAIAGVIAMRPKIMAFDEPLAMLDPIGKRRVLSILKNLAQEHNLTLIISESGADIELLMNIIERVVILYNGRIIIDGEPKEVFSSELPDDIRGIRPPVTELFIRLRKKYSDIRVPIDVNGAVEILANEFSRIDDFDEKIKSITKNRKISRDNLRSSNGKILIKVKNLHHIYPSGVHALKGVTMNIYEGEIVGLIGQNGSGKTTLAKHLVGILKPTNNDAEISVMGLSPAREPILKTTEVINYVFQNPDEQLFCDSVWEEIAFGLKARGYSPKEVEQKTLKIIKLFGLEEYKDVYPGHLPIHLRKLVVIAAVLALNPKILIVDEPTTGLDEIQIDRIVGMLVDLVRRGQLKSLIIITHDMDTVAKYCNRVIVMNNGQIALDGSPRDVFTKIDVLESISISPPQITQLAVLLSKYGIPPDLLTIDEAYELLDEIFKIKTKALKMER